MGRHMSTQQLIPDLDACGILTCRASNRTRSGGNRGGGGGLNWFGLNCFGKLVLNSVK